MRLAFLITALLLLGRAGGYAADTAYSALRVVGKDQGPETLSRVLELRGRFGAPEPESWKVVLDDQRARGGVREVEVRKGRIVSQRTPVGRTAAGAAMNFNQLNLDSEGAFTIANQEAKKAEVPFDRVDYVLQSGTRGSSPVWVVELMDARKGRVGSMEIAADSGTVLRKEFVRNGAVTQRESDRLYAEGREDEEYLDRDERVTPRDPDDEYAESEALRNVDEFAQRLGKRFEKRGRQFKNFFTGRGFRDDR